jgi:hypothetical protein
MAWHGRSVACHYIVSQSITSRFTGHPSLDLNSHINSNIKPQHQPQHDLLIHTTPNPRTLKSPEERFPGDRDDPNVPSRKAVKQVERCHLFLFLFLFSFVFVQMLLRCFFFPLFTIIIIITLSHSTISLRTERRLAGEQGAEQREDGVEAKEDSGSNDRCVAYVCVYGMVCCDLCCESVFDRLCCVLCDV